MTTPGSQWYNINVVSAKIKRLQLNLRECWNWQTGTFEGRVLYDVRVQVSSRAPERSGKPRRFFGSFIVYRNHRQPVIPEELSLQAIVSSHLNPLPFFFQSGNEAVYRKALLAHMIFLILTGLLCGWGRRESFCKWKKLLAF